MKRTILSLLMLMMAIAGFCDGNTWVVLTLRGETTIAYHVPERMVVSNDGDSLRLTTNSMEVAYAKKNVRSYSFLNDNDTFVGIEQVVDKGISIDHVNADEISIKGIPTNAAVHVYGINGVEHTGRMHIASDGVTISLRSLPRGTYLIKVEGLAAIKILH